MSTKMKPLNKKTSTSNLLSQVHSLAWDGKHKEAIDLASQELEKSGLSPALQINLLDLRAESYMAQGKLDASQTDVDTMRELAGEDPAHIAQALLQKAGIQMRRGDSQDAIKSAERALSFAKESQEKALQAQVLLSLGEAQYREDESEAGIKTAGEAVALFNELDDLSGEGRAYWVISINYWTLNKTDASCFAADTALELCRQAGDQLGIGNAYAAFGYNEADEANRIRYFQLAEIAFEKAGYIQFQLVASLNIAAAYLDLGLYHQARRLYAQGIGLLHAIGARHTTAYVLINLIEIEILTGHYPQAYKYLEEFEKIIQGLGARMESYILDTKGWLYSKEGHFKEAIHQYISAIAFSKKKKLGREVDLLTMLGGAYLTGSQPLLALKTTTEATELHRAGDFFEIDGASKQAIWWNHVQALVANEKTQKAQEALDQAYDFLLEGIQGLHDIGLQRSYLNKVETNRDFLQYWLAEGKKRELAEERLYAYLHIESNTREPFQRLTNTSQQLNALKTISEIQTFLVEEATELSGGERVMLILEDGEKLDVAKSILPRGEDAGETLSSIKKHLNPARLARDVQLVAPKRHGRSRIVVPLIAQDQIIGYLYVDMDTIYGRFDETDRNMLGMLGNQTAVALDNASLVTGLEEKVQERTAQLQESVYETERLLKESRTLAAVGRDISTSLETKIVLENIASYAKNLLGGNLSALFLPEMDDTVLRAIVATGDASKEIRNETILIGDGILGNIAKSKRAEIVNNTGHDPRARIVAGTESQTDEHLLAAPLLAGDELKGLMSVWRTGKERDFIENELTFLTNLAEQAVIALQNAQLFSEAQEARTVAEEANKMKSAFLANMSHELRTPLNAIINFTELIYMGVMGDVNEAQADALGHSLSSSKHLLHLINDILDISKMQAGKLVLLLEEDVDLRVEINEALKTVEPLLQKQMELYEYDVKLVKDVDDNLPLLTCDRRRIRQVLLNLLSNAIKFTQEGSIILRAKYQDGHLQFAVIDSGQGIEKALQSQIFEPFTQTLDGIKMAEGTGLGLPITRNLIEAHNGNIWLESEVGKGSTFFFTLPIA